MPEKKIGEMSEMELYFVIDGLGGFIWRMNHDMADGRIPKEHHAAIDADIARMRETQLEAIRELPRIGIAVPLDEQGRGTDEYWKWYRTWSKWHKDTLSPLEWDELNTLMSKGLLTADIETWCKAKAFNLPCVLFPDGNPLHRAQEVLMQEEKADGADVGLDFPIHW